MISAARDDDRRRSPWYRDGRYVNLDDEDFADEGALKLLAFLRWQLSRAEAPRIAWAADLPSEVRPLAPEELAPPARGLKLAWLGHASLHVAAPRLAIAIDPIFGSPPLVRRLAPPPIAAERLPPVRLILLSHNHFDHLHPASLRALAARNPDVLALVPSGLGNFVRSIGIRSVRTLEWWESTTIDGVRITFVPARHWSARGLGDTRQSHWAGFVIEADGARVYFAGDTAMGRHFDPIAARFAPVDVAVMPIGAYSPRWFMRDRHLDPPEAVAAARTLRAGLMLPVHWGTFKLTDEPLGEPPIYALEAARTAGQALKVWRPGDLHMVEAGAPAPGG